MNQDVPESDDLLAVGDAGRHVRFDACQLRQRLADDSELPLDRGTHQVIGLVSGQYRELANGVSELKIDVGPGYRVYYMQRGNVLLLLLAGGDKSTQQKDIARAIRLASIHEE